MSLTLHLDAADTGHIFTTYQASGVHTGTPSDSSAVEIWDDEGDGVTDVMLVYGGTTADAPLWRSSTPLMLQPCLDFDGSSDYLETYTQTGGAGKPISSFITTSAYTLLIACYPEVISATATPAAGHTLCSDSAGVWGLYLYNASGQRKAQLINYTTGYDLVEVNITEATRMVLAARHDAGNLYLSVNGGTEVGPVASGNTFSVTGRLALGWVAGGAAFYNGRIGELKIWNTGNADGAGNVATQIAAMMSKWVTAAPTTTVIAQDRSIRRRLHPRVFSRVN